MVYARSTAVKRQNVEGGPPKPVLLGWDFRIPDYP